MVSKCVAAYKGVSWSSRRPIKNLCYLFVVLQNLYLVLVLSPWRKHRPKIRSLLTFWNLVAPEFGCILSKNKKVNFPQMQPVIWINSLNILYDINAIWNTQNSKNSYFVRIFKYKVAQEKEQNIIHNMRFNISLWQYVFTVCTSHYACLIISFLTMEYWNQTLQYFLGARGILHSTLPREYTD